VHGCALVVLQHLVVVARIARLRGDLEVMVQSALGILMRERVISEGSGAASDVALGSPSADYLIV